MGDDNTVLLIKFPRNVTAGSAVPDRTTISDVSGKKNNGVLHGSGATYERDEETGITGIRLGEF